MLITGQDSQSIINSAQAQARYNNKWSAEQATIQREFQTESNAKAMAFSQAENQRNREFQERMSNSSHQREVKDLIAAGINPILSANNGASAPIGNSAQGISSQGAKGDTDTSITSLFSGMLQAIIGQATALTTTSMNNQTQLTTTAMMNDMASKVATIGASAMLGTANINARTNLSIQEKAQAFEEYIKATYPQTVPGSINALKESFSNFLKDQNNGKSVSQSMTEFIEAVKKGRQNGGTW